jgi:hypothetical protein
MELTITLTPTIIAALCVIGAAIILRLISDAKDIRSNAILSRHLQELGKKKAEKMIGVVIELRKKADTIIPLLDELYAQQYKHQETIILVHHTAGKNAISTLRHYGAKHAATKSFHIVTMRAKMTVIDVIKKYSHSTLITMLTPDQHISKRFFSNIALDYSLKKPDRIILGRRVILNKTIRSALQAQTMMWRQIIIKRKQKIVPQTFSSGIVYKRSSLTSKHSSGEVIYSSTSSIAEIASTKKIFRQHIISFANLFRRVLGLIITILAFVGIGFVLVSATPQEILVLAISITAAYVLMYVGMLVRETDYSGVDKLNLTLLTPIFLILYALLYIAGVVLSLLTLPRLVTRYVKK